MNIVESIARSICVSKGIDPDQETVGMGAVMPEGEKYQLWEYQAQFVQTVIDQYEAE